MPTSTSLVTNLPADFNTFGQAVDTSMAQLKGGTTGQVLSKTSATDMAFTWVTPTDQTPLTTKGDLFTFTTVDARLAVGNNGETLVADSSTTTGLRYQSNYASGLNKLLNSDFSIWQRGTSTNAGANTHTFVSDRWQCFQNGSGTCTVAQQSFTVGQTDVPNNPTYFIRVTGGTGTSYVSDLVQYVENVSTFAGQTVTVSFYAKASSSQTIGVILAQNFGSGGSTQVDTSVTLSASTLTTSWVRYTGTVTLPSITGKTVGTGNYLGVRIRNSSTSNGTTWDLSNVKIEAGSVATAFQTATGTIQGELAACQRYYYRFGGSYVYEVFGFGSGASATAVYAYVKNPVTFRVAPTSVDYANLSIQDGAGGNVTFTTLTNSGAAKDTQLIQASGATGLTQYRPYFINANNSTSAYLGFSAEL